MRNPPYPVILNLFQNPFLATRGAWIGKLASPLDSVA